MTLINMMKQYCSSKMQMGLAIIQEANRHHLTIMWGISVLYRISLDVLYLFAVSPQYAYAGLTVAPYAIKYVLSWVLYLLVFATMPKQENSISSFCLNLQFAITVAPLTCYYGLNNQSTKYMLMVVVVVLLQNWILRPSKADTAAGIRIIGVSPYVSVFMLILIPSCIGIAMLWNGFQGSNAFDSNFLYSMRENATYPPFLPYFLHWLSAAIIPFLLAFSLHSKRFLLAMSLVVADLVLYMVKGNKFIYLSLLVVLGVFLIAKIGIPVKLLYFGFTALCFGSTLLFLLERSVPDAQVSVLINSLFGIRFLFIPAQAKFLHYECFSEYPRALFSDGQIGNAFGLTYPYTGSLGDTVFSYDTGRMFASESNTGYLGESYAQMGFMGLVVVAVLLALLVKFFAACAERRLFPVFAAAVATQFIILNDGAFLTTLLTGGFFLLIIFAIVYTSPNETDGKIHFERKSEWS